MLGTLPLVMAEQNFRDRVVAAIKDRGWDMKQAARETGVSYDVIRELHRRPGSSTKAENAAKLAAVLGLDNESDAGEARPGPLGKSDDLADEAYTLIPVYNVEASAGTGLVPPDHEAIAYRLELPADYLATLTDSHPRHLQVISVKGISMLPTLKPGDLVMIDRAKTSLAFDGLFVIDIDGAILVKRIGRSTRKGFVNVISDNEDQPSFERAIRDIVVLGKVICAIVKQ